MTWNFNINEAPEGEEVKKIIQNPKGERTHINFMPAKVWTASKCGKCFISWKLENGRWNGYAEGEYPIAFFILPSHPGDPCSQ